MSIPAKIVCLMGPTASGKTQLAVDLVKHFPFEIISVDSAMVYRGMDIGTAKPSADILKIAPHRLIDIREPEEAYSAAQFREDALREIADILQRGKIPLLVGGTMLYFKALQKGLSDLPSADQAVRARLSAEAEEFGWAALHARLHQVDPVSAARIHPHDAQRIQRALEVYEVSHKNMTDWHAGDDLSGMQYEMVNLAVTPLERSILHERIEKRFAQMLEAGLVEEVQRMLSRIALSSDLPSMRCVGYRQVLAYLAGELSYEEMRARGVFATRQLAKRQLTWLRSWPSEIFWLDSSDQNLFLHAVDFLRDAGVLK